MSPSSFVGVPTEVVVATFVIAIVGSATPLALPANRTAYLLLTNTTFALYLVTGPRALAVTLPAALIVLLVRAFSGATRRPTLELAVSMFALAVGIGIGHALSHALGAGYPQPLATLEDLVRTSIILSVVYGSFGATKELVSRSAFGLAPLDRTESDVLERAPTLYTFGALAFGPVLVLALAVFEIAGAHSFIAIVLSATVAHVAIPFEVRRVARMRALVEDRSRRARLDALAEHSARIAHHLRHQVILIGLSLDRIDDRLRTLGIEEPIISEELSRLGNVRDELRDLLRDEREHVLAEIPTGWKSVLESPLPRIAALAQRRGVTLVTHLDEIPGGGPRDPRKLAQAWFNVVENGVSAATSRVVLRARFDDETVVLSIDDDGPGMSDDVFARATDPFFTTKPEGTGMGLSIALAVAEELGGGIELERLERGMRVSIRIPRADR